MKNVIHSIDTWFGNTAGLITYFEQSFEGNTMGKLRFPASHVKRHTDSSGTFDKEAAIKGVAGLYLQAIVKMHSQLKTMPFTVLESDTQKLLKEALCGTIQHALLNRNVWERLNSSNITTGSITMNVDTTSWIVTEDMFGKFAWALMMNSGIDEYEWIEEDVLFAETSTGNLKVIGKVDLSVVKDLTGRF